MYPLISEVWFWQDILTPHMSALAESLAGHGVHVTYVAIQYLTSDRIQQGWVTQPLHYARLKLAPTSKDVKALLDSASPESIHLCQGLRGNRLIASAQRIIRKRGLRHWVIMESVDDGGSLGLIKRTLYSGLFCHWRPTLEGVLAIGHGTPDWIAARGMPRSNVFPFAYFLAYSHDKAKGENRSLVGKSHSFRIIFVGRLVKLKRVDALIHALAELDRTDIELWVVGGGPLQASLQAAAAQKLPGRVKWLGVQPMHNVTQLIAKVDCLVLPSRYDGWGAVVSEALMVGTPAICSSACGVSELVQESQDGGVFSPGDPDSLRNCIARQVQKGLVSHDRRRAIADWAFSLSAKAGASYLYDILSYRASDTERPVPPWLAGLL